MKKLILLITSILFASLVGCTEKEETDNAQLETDISPVLPKINSTVTRILVEDNQAVKEGDVLVMLDDANYKIAVQQAEVAVALAKQNVVLSRSGRSTISSSVSSATANSDAVEANMSSAKAGIEALLTIEGLEKNHFYHTALGDFYCKNNQKI